VVTIGNAGLTALKFVQQISIQKLIVVFSFASSQSYVFTSRDVFVCFIVIFKMRHVIQLITCAAQCICLFFQSSYIRNLFRRNLYV